MSQITDAAEAVVRRSVKMFPVLRDLEAHLIAEQIDAIAGPAQHPSERTTPNGPIDPEEQAVDIGHSNPVPSAAARMGRYTNMNRQMLKALDSLNKAMDHVERTAAGCMSTRIDPTLFDEPKCPGWTVELQARLGGCGKHLEGYRRNDGTTGLLALCAGCRKAKGRAERAEDQAA